jgi:hypothetical protein
MKSIRIEGISPNIGRVAVVIDPKHILCVLDTYEDVLPCPAFKSLEQYYVMFYPSLDLPPIITTSELSPDIKDWIYTILNTY